MTPPFARLRYLYVGTSDTAADVRYYRDVLGAEVVWDLKEFGAHVAAVRLGEGPLLILADHRTPKSVIVIFEVPDLARTMKDLERRGWKPEGAPFELPDGTCVEFTDPTGNTLALLEPSRGAPLEQESASTHKGSGTGSRGRSK